MRATFSWGTIIFILIIGYNFLFDDEDEKQIEIIDTAKEVITDIRESDAVQTVIKRAKEHLEIQPDVEVKEDPPMETRVEEEIITQDPIEELDKKSEPDFEKL